MKLNRARGWLVEHPNQLTAQEREFIHASIETAEAEERRKVKLRRLITRVSISAAVVLAAVVVTLAIQWTRTKDALKIATSGRLATAALIHKESQLGLASLLGAEALEFAPTYEARNSLLLTTQFNPKLLTYLRHATNVLSVAFSPDGKTLASAGYDGTVRLWDVASRQPLGEPRIYAKVPSQGKRPTQPSRMRSLLLSQQQKHSRRESSL